MTGSSSARAAPARRTASAFAAAPMLVVSHPHHIWALLPAARPSSPLEPALHSATSAEGSEPGQAGLDFATVHYVVLVTESYLRLYVAEGLRQGGTPYRPFPMSNCHLAVLARLAAEWALSTLCDPLHASVAVRSWL